MRKTLAAMLMIGSFGAQAEWKQVSSSIMVTTFTLISPPSEKVNMVIALGKLPTIKSLVYLVPDQQKL